MKSILILGATSDVAVAIARRFAEEKYSLLLAARDKDNLERIGKDIAIRSQVEVKTILFDAANFSTHSDFYKSLGVTPDVSVCVFGYLGDQQKAETDWKEAERIIQVNYTGAASILSIIAEDYELKGKGTIVGISSVAGERGRQSNYFYGSAKAGFTAYLSGLRNRMFKAGVHVITVKPGFINTKMTEGLNLPKPVTAQPEQLGKAIFNAVKKKKDVIYVLPAWRLIMLIIRNIPEGIFKKLKL